MENSSKETKEVKNKMPGGDRTGPEGYGPKTGRALGYCSGYNSPGYTKGTPRGRGFGRGFGRRFGRGRGFGRRGVYRDYYYPESHYEPAQYRSVSPEPTKDEEKRYLEDTIKALEEDLKTMKERLNTLSKEKQ